MADWAKIKNEYINGSDSYRKLAKKHGVSPSTLTQRAIREKWAAARTEQMHRIEAETAQKTIDLIAGAHADSLTHISKVAEKVVMLVDEAVTDISAATKKQIYIDDLAKIAKILKDAKDTQTAILPPDNGPLMDDGFLAALHGEAAETWEDGDDA